MRSVRYEPVDVLWSGTPYPSHDAYGPIEACKVPTVLSGSRPHRSGTSQRYAHPTPDLCTRRQLSGGPGLLSQRPPDTDQPARVVGDSNRLLKVHGAPQADYRRLVPPTTASAAAAAAALRLQPGGGSSGGSGGGCELDDDDLVDFADRCRDLAARLPP